MSTTAKPRTADHEPKLVHEAPVVDIDAEEEDFIKSSRRWWRSKTVLSIGLVSAVVAALVLWKGDFFGESTEHLVFYTVARGDLSITVSDRKRRPRQPTSPTASQRAASPRACSPGAARSRSPA